VLFHALLVLNSSDIPLVKRSLEIKSNSLCPYNTGVVVWMRQDVENI